MPEPVDGYIHCISTSTSARAISQVRRVWGAINLIEKIVTDAASQNADRWIELKQPKHRPLDRRIPVVKQSSIYHGEDADLRQIGVDGEDADLRQSGSETKFNLSNNPPLRIRQTGVDVQVLSKCRGACETQQP